ncbi:hypothetical protein PoB_000143500 [Plakobranchus ocellatus]|uniref:Uncharacterized protein n=1 Tax=Plakobranchus ocellatus TaxID=259542 RepID=A0AAV3XVT2_9GAST|nr:hypothetical protein PoB_000143500 [Plakobranchus ocellatus]
MHWLPKEDSPETGTFIIYTSYLATSVMDTTTRPVTSIINTTSSSATSATDTTSSPPTTLDLDYNNIGP